MPTTSLHYQSTNTAWMAIAEIFPRTHVPRGCGTRE